MNKLWDSITRLVELIGNIVGFLIIIITAVITYEVIARYLFNAPTSWAWLVNKQIFGVFVIVAGSYALIHKIHIRIEVLYEHFPDRLKRLVHWLSLSAAFCFLGSLLWKSSVMGLEAWHTQEKAVGVFKLPLYPLKMIIPLGVALYLFACIAVYFKKEKEEDIQ